MKKGMLALTVLSCVLLVGAPACKHRKEHAKSPPPSHKQKERKKAAKKPAPKEQQATKAAQLKRSDTHKK